ncbi:FAD:protein FMN transferase [Pelagicoccus sp. SDUM812005]|uniref:FAD:protein FMN transferase n=1 Tax=Pelagicoccus sp. SDUM812005 TaxID=3041257 RepID=UPI00280E6149|nr:FAD:protein FMN transferase [Pelagicoccus sp. SDUM812005]MDQ8180974.1 FAD:protein FMN transferase [Pelagicoccus sp. SDUM812005]
MLRIDEKGELFSFRHEAMAADLVVSLGGVDQDYARQTAQAFFARVDEIEAKLSLYQESSDVTRINLMQPGDETRVSEECMECLQLAMAASGLTGERFHPFLGVDALKVKGNVPAYLNPLLRSDEAVELFSAVQIDPQSRYLKKLAAGVILDFGGIGKGFALDQGMLEIEDWEIPVAMANFGGSTLLFRAEESAEPWTAKLGERSLKPFRSGAFSSSGTGFQGEHIVSRSGRPLLWKRSFARSQSAALADALTTGAMLMGEGELEALCAAEEGLALAATGEGVSWGVERFCDWEG